jgi:hypothetical protein
LGTEWRELDFYNEDSVESRTVFEFLKTGGNNNQCPEDSSTLGSNVSIISAAIYADNLAPLGQPDDFSTATRMRDRGDKLTGERLAAMGTE